MEKTFKMEKTFNFILIIGVLIALYYCIQKYKNINKEKSVVSESNKILEEFNMDKIYNENIPESSKIKFDYEVKPIEKQFMKEQELGVNLNSWYPNTWIEKIDENNNPVYNSRENVTGIKDEIVEAKTLNSYLFDPQRNINMGGVVDVESPEQVAGKTLREIYDNSFIDYRKTIPKKIMTQTEPGFNVVNAASNLSYFTDDTWTYENEKPENGGILYDGISASDPLTIGTVALF